MTKATSKAHAPAVSYEGALGHAFSDKRIEILRLTGACGSISQAARDAGVSYKAAWQAIDTLTNLAGVALVERAVGGSGGGGASLTPAGLQLLDAAEQVEAARRKVLAGLQGGATTAGRSGALGVAQLSIRTSMRNQLPCVVARLEGSGQIVRVTLQVAEGVALVSRITRESAELLGLHEGLPVLALCKATAVKAERAPVTASKRATGINLLQGRANRISRGDTGDEIALEIGAGLQLVGFAPAGSGLRVGSRVLARMEESAVVIALAG
ncbi:TOBE domain-containing protein [soil metagenome]